VSMLANESRRGDRLPARIAREIKRVARAALMNE
jgi:hypothetical protein